MKNDASIRTALNNAKIKNEAKRGQLILNNLYEVVIWTILIVSFSSILKLYKERRKTFVVISFATLVLLLCGILWSGQDWNIG